MYGLTRGVLTLIGAAAAGVLLWLGAQVISGDSVSAGEHWTALGLVALAGLTMALSQLLGGWTKWGWPRVSGNVFLIGFLPVLVVGGWVLAAGEPGEHWLGSHVRNWSGDIGLGGLVSDLTVMVPAIAFGIGLVFGLTFDTTGPRVRRAATPVPARADEERTSSQDRSSEDRRVHIDRPDSADGPGAPEPEPRPADRSQD